MNTPTNEWEKEAVDAGDVFGRKVLTVDQVKNLLTTHTAHLVEKEREAIRTRIENLTMIDEKYAHWAKKEILDWCFPPKNQAIDIIKNNK